MALGIETTSNSNRKNRMWPSFETAACIQNYANGFLILALFVGVVATFLVVWMGNVKEDYLRRDIALGNDEAAKAKESASKANERTAALENETAQAKLETERIKAIVQWRELPKEATDKLRIALAKHPAAAQIQYVANDPEAFAFALRVTTAFKKAGWQAAMFSISHPTMLMVGLFIADEKQPETSNVKSAFREAGIAFAEGRVPPGGFFMGDPADAKAGAVVIVGSKPRRELEQE